MADGRRPRVVGIVTAKLASLDPSALTGFEALRQAAGAVPGEIVSAGTPLPVREGMFDGLAWRATVRTSKWDSTTSRPGGEWDAPVVLFVGRLGELTVGITAFTPGLKLPLDLDDAMRLLSGFDMRQGGFTIPARP